MDHFRFSTIAHSDHTFCSPLSSSKADQLVALLDLPAGARTLDVGCGKGELLLRLVQRYGATGVGVDPNSEFLREARAGAAMRGISAKLKWHELKAADFATEPESFDAALCIGSNHAFGTFAQALTAISALVRPGGLLLMANAYWRKAPPADYLAFLGGNEDDHLTHAGNESAGLAAGLTPLYSCVSNADEWDHYEGLYCRAIERFSRDHPRDPDAEQFRTRIRAWRDIYRRFGRETLGFGFYLFQA